MSAALVFPMTLAAAAVLPDEIRSELVLSDLTLTRGDRARVAAAWLWLCGVADDDADADHVRREALSDADLIVALSLPALEFFRWFRAADWALFTSTERTGSEAWAMQALQRAWGACEGLGALASQRPIHRPV